MSRILIVGRSGGTHLGASFASAAERLGLRHALASVGLADGAPRLLRSLAWRLDRGFARPGAFRREFRRLLAAEPTRLVLVLGAAPLNAADLQLARAAGAVTALFLTDDPFNTSTSGRWYRALLPGFDLVLNPRRLCEADLRAAGVKRLERLCFGYDRELFKPSDPWPEEDLDAGFVGSGDADRAPYIEAVARSGVSFELHGGHWERQASVRALARGQAAPAEFCRVAARARASICLVRRANRDGHVMRTFELLAAGAAIVADDTPEHREIYGEDGETALFFTAPDSLVRAIRELSAAPERRRAMRARAKAMVAAGRHSYDERLREILAMLGAGPT